MTIRVRYRPLELSAGVVEDLDADSYVVLDDNTVELRRTTSTDETTGKSKYRVVGHLHPERWDKIEVFEEAEQD